MRLVLQRVKRASVPAVKVPSVTAGMMRCQTVALPDEGSTCSTSENSRISRIPRKKFGSAKPKTAKAIIARSRNRPRSRAAAMPAGMPTSAASR